MTTPQPGRIVDQPTNAEIMEMVHRIPCRMYASGSITRMTPYRRYWLHFDRVCLMFFFYKYRY